jgi:hypothetical protein
MRELMMIAEKNRVRLSVEPLDERISPSNLLGPLPPSDPQVVASFEIKKTTDKVDGFFTVTPSAAQASPHVVEINQQVVQVNLPTGEVLPGHGLKTAEAHTPVVDWTRT